MVSSIEKAQQLLRDKGYTLEQVEQVTSELTALANIISDQYLAGKKVDNINRKTI